MKVRLEDFFSDISGHPDHFEIHEMLSQFSGYFTSVYIDWSTRTMELHLVTLIKTRSPSAANVFPLCLFMCGLLLEGRMKWHEMYKFWEPTPRQYPDWRGAVRG